jgi:hypothetical protein
MVGKRLVCCRVLLGLLAVWVAGAGAGVGAAVAPESVDRSWLVKRSIAQRSGGGGGVDPTGSPFWLHYKSKAALFPQLETNMSYTVCLARGGGRRVSLWCTHASNHPPPFWAPFQSKASSSFRFEIIAMIIANKTIENSLKCRRLYTVNNRRALVCACRGLQGRGMRGWVANGWTGASIPPGAH